MLTILCENNNFLKNHRIPIEYVLRKSNKNSKNFYLFPMPDNKVIFSLEMELKENLCLVQDF